jgi:heme-degrading monooxygenase HmoA
VDGTVRVLLYVRDPRDAPGSVEAAYHEVSLALHGTPGLLGNELLRAVGRDGSFAVLSEWADLTSFLAWQQGPDHRTTSALRPLQDDSTGSTFAVYQVAATY